MAGLKKIYSAVTLKEAEGTLLQFGETQSNGILKMLALPDGVRMVWAIRSVVLVLAGFLFSVICIKSGEPSRPL